MYLQPFSSPCDGAKIHTQRHTENTLTVAAAAGGRALWRRRSLIKVSEGTQRAWNVPTVFALCPLRATVPPLDLCISGPAPPLPPSLSHYGHGCSPQAAPLFDPCNERPSIMFFKPRAFVSGRYFLFYFFSHHRLLTLLTLLTLHALSPSDSLFTGAANTAHGRLNFPLFPFLESSCTSTRLRSHFVAKLVPS